MAEIEKLGFGNTPVCVAKTQYSLSDDPKVLGRPEGFEVTVRNRRTSITPMDIGNPNLTPDKQHTPVINVVQKGALETLYKQDLSPLE